MRLAPLPTRHPESYREEVRGALRSATRSTRADSLSPIVDPDCLRRRRRASRPEKSPRRRRRVVSASRPPVSMAARDLARQGRPPLASRGSHEFDLQRCLVERAGRLCVRYFRALRRAARFDRSRPRSQVSRVVPHDSPDRSRRRSAHDPAVERPPIRGLDRRARRPSVDRRVPAELAPSSRRRQPADQPHRVEVRSPTAMD